MKLSCVEKLNHHLMERTTISRVIGSAPAVSKDILFFMVFSCVSGHDRYYNKYINVKKGGIGGLAMVLAGYVAISYLWEYDHISKKYSHDTQTHTSIQLKCEKKNLMFLSSSRTWPLEEVPLRSFRSHQTFWGWSSTWVPLIFLFSALLCWIWLLWPINNVKIYCCLECSLTC